MDPAKRQFISDCAVSARMVGHPFPLMAACEACLESQKPGAVPFTLSQLAVQGNNLFGMKAHQHNEFGTLNLPTHEFLDGNWKVVEAPFEKYPTLDDCFEDRFATLRRLAPIYPHYKAAITATDPEVYITEVSKTWSTDPDRAAHVLEIFREYIADLTLDA
jgi:flagellum-specific peptidoglycan hydrolase FlgJ